MKTRLIGLLLVVALLAPLSMGAGGGSGCGGAATQQSQQDQLAQLQKLAKLAEGTEKAVALIRQVQDTEVMAFDQHLIPNYTLEQHQKVQAAFKVFYDKAEPFVQAAKDSSKAGADRRSAVASLVAAANGFIAGLDIPNPNVKAALIAVGSALLILNAEV